MPREGAKVEEVEVGADLASSPDVILNRLKARGQDVRSMEPAKAKRRLRLCVKLGYISQRQADALTSHLKLTFA